MPLTNAERCRRYAKKMAALGINKKAEWRKKNPDKSAVEKGGWYLRNKEKILAKHRERRRRKREQMADRPRPEKCEICKKKGKVVWDHCHKSGKFRGWICQHCNTALGRVMDSVEILAEMIAYLQKNQ